MTTLSYEAVTWTLYQCHIGHVRHIQQKHIRAILRIRYQDHKVNYQVLELANTQDVEVTLYMV